MSIGKMIFEKNPDLLEEEELVDVDNPSSRYFGIDQNDK